MCANCGCEGDRATLHDFQTGETTTISAVHQHESDHHHVHNHQRDHDAPPNDHAHHHGPHQYSGDDHGHPHHIALGTAANILEIETRILKRNDEQAAKNRAWFAGREILGVNLVSAPGAGKTALLERTIRDLAGELPLYIIEGDQATTNDGERIRQAGAAVVQINTGTGCHLDAPMVARALSALKPPTGAVLLIENVGNLVCPALFDLGEREKVVIFSVTDGEDKPLKYPHIFQAATLVLFSKVDVVPYLDFSLERAIANVERINPHAKILQISARSGTGMSGWYDWIRHQSAAARRFVV